MWRCRPLWARNGRLAFVSADMLLWLIIACPLGVIASPFADGIIPVPLAISTPGWGAGVLRGHRSKSPLLVEFLHEECLAGVSWHG